MSDLIADTIPDDSLQPREGPHADVHDARRILVTGTTGLVGGFLLRELLSQTTADILCLVRATTPHEARTRVRAHLQRHEIWTPSMEERITPVPGDLSLPGFGLTATEFDALAEATDVVFHAGASVHFMQPYAGLRATNVLGTREVLRLACRRKPTAVHYVSSVAAFAGAAGRAVAPGLMEIRESDAPPEMSGGQSGYSQSKWAAETLAANARARGLPIAIYRPATIIGHGLTGSTSHVGSTLLRAWVAVGAVPSDLRDLNVVPVDYVAKAIVHLAAQRASIGRAFHLINPVKTPFRDIFNLLRAHGHALTEIPNAELRQRLSEKIATARDAKLLYLYLTAAELEKQLRPRPTRLRFRDDNTAHGLAGTSIRCPVIDRAMLDTFYSHLSSSGLLRVS